MASQLMPRALAVITLAVLFAGCFSGGGGGLFSHKSGPAYAGELKEFDLYLFPLSVGAADCAGWQLYPGTVVDAWAWAPENDCHKATIPGPTIRVRQGDTVRVNFYTFAPMAHTIHFHGLSVPWDQDGVPYVSQIPIGEKRMGGSGAPEVTYQFNVTQSGTYWYHCHVDTAHHMDMGMYGPLIVDPADSNEDPHYDLEQTLMFDEWDKSHAHQNTAAMNNAISKSGDPSVTANDLYSFWRDYLVMNGVYNDTLAGGALKNAPGVRETRNWYPVTYAPYFATYDTFLINGKAFPDTQPILVQQGQVLRMRFINAGEQVHLIHLHGHHMLVTHKDGYSVPLLAQLGDGASKIKSFDELRKYAQPVDTLLIGPGERYDVYVYLDNPGPWMLHDHIALNEQNDEISPGGMSTMICYTDGWEHADMCADGLKTEQQGGAVTVGDLLKSQVAFLGAELPVSDGDGGTMQVDMPDMPGVSSTPGGPQPASSSSTSAAGTSGLPVPSVPTFT